LGATDGRWAVLFIILALVGLAIAILWLGRIFYILQKGLNEIITGLTSIDQRLARVEARLAAQQHDPGTEA
jgi:TM2 domain-containing membrane protein YozV